MRISRIANSSRPPMYKFFIFIFICILISQILIAKRPSEISFTVLFYLGTLAIFLFFGLCGKLVQPYNYPLNYLTIITYFYCFYFYSVGLIISYVYNDSKLLSVIEFPYRISSLFIIIVLPWVIRQEKDMNFLFILLMIWNGLLLIQDMIFWMIGVDQTNIVVDSYRMVGSEYSSVALNISFPFAFAGLIAYWNNPKYRTLIRGLLLTFIILSILKIFLSFSRAYWLVIFPLNIIGAICMASYKSHISQFFRIVSNKIIKLTVIFTLTGTIAAVLIGVFNPTYTQIIITRFDQVNKSASNRFDEYNKAFEEWSSSPIWGKGFAYEATFYKGNRLRHQQYIHNLIMQFLMSSGLIGLSIVLILFGEMYVQLLKLFKRSKSILQAAILIANLLIVTNILLSSFIQTTIQNQQTYFVLAIVISFVVIIERLQNEKRNNSYYLHKY